MDAVFSVDVERDLHSNALEGITRGIPRIETLLDKHGIKATFFVTAELFEKFPAIFKRLHNKGHEIALHSYNHRRYDLMSYKEKKQDLIMSIRAYKRLFGHAPGGFRAPQHSLDDDALSLLKGYGFSYDSSTVPFNIMLLRHLLKRGSDKAMILRNFFSKTRPHKMKNGLVEIPRTALLLALGGFELKVYPKFINKIIALKLHLLRIPLVFTMHSWDMIKIKGSRTSALCNPKEFEEKLSAFISNSKKYFRYRTMEGVAKKIK